MDILEKVKKLISEQLDVEEANIQESSSISDDLCEDSMDVVRLRTSRPLAISSSTLRIINKIKAARFASQVGRFLRYFRRKCLVSLLATFAKKICEFCIKFFVFLKITVEILQKVCYNKIGFNLNICC